MLSILFNCSHRSGTWSCESTMTKAKCKMEPAFSKEKNPSLGMEKPVYSCFGLSVAVWPLLYHMTF